MAGQLYLRYKDIELALKAEYLRIHAYADYALILRHLVAAGMATTVRSSVRARSGLSLEEFMECVEQSQVPVGPHGEPNPWGSEESALIPPNFGLFAFKHFRYFEREVHPHGCFDITYVYHGCARLDYEGVRTALHEGDLCLMAPGSSYVIDREDEGVILLTVYLRRSVMESTFFEALTRFGVVSDFLRDVLYEQKTPNYLLFHAQERSNVREVMQNLFIETNYPDRFAAEASVHWAHLLFVTVLRDFDFAHAYRGVDKTDVYFYGVLEYVQRNLATVTLGQVATEFGYNESYLSTLFLAKVKRNFRDYVSDLRMDRARTLLSTTQMTVEQVAQAIGYGSADHLQRKFKRETGMTPGQWRKAWQT